MLMLSSDDENVAAILDEEELIKNGLGTNEFYLHDR